MTEQQDFQSLDELFRSTFNNLPDSPSPAGWDQPSDQVWTQVEKAIPAKTGWTPAQTLASGLVVVAIALTAYWLLRPVSDVRQDQPLPSQEIPAPAPAQEASPLSPATAEVPVAQPSAAKPVLAPASHKSALSPQLPVLEQTTDRAQLIQEAAPLPGTNPTASPNTTELLKREIWSRPAPYIPTVLEKQLNKQ